MWWSAQTCGFLCAIPFRVESCLLLAVHTGELSFPQALSFSQVRLIASLCNMSTSSLKWLSNLSLPETPLHHSVISTVISGKFPVHQGLFASLRYAHGRTNQREAAISVCLKLQVLGGGTEWKVKSLCGPENTQSLCTNHSLWVWACGHCDRGSHFSDIPHSITYG